MKNVIAKYTNLLAAPAFWLVLLAITILSLWPGHAEPPTSPWTDKVNHGLAYFALGVTFLAKTLSKQVTPIFSRKLLRGFLLLWAFSGLMELIQGTQMIGRTSSFLDLLANAGGLALAIIFGQIILLAWQRK
ncbi:hypothetical protein MNBD_ALPHA06-1984 [hydrothermal vent metagenome]|uniref:VanZ-like domain-containing protein n=1 Tax=hydrothermal vent metagenome TaxID=652676 RepID=A0A3B0RVU0_9ZZZZ